MSSESPLKPHVQKAVSDAESGSTIEVPSHEPPRKFFSLSSFDDPVLLRRRRARILPVGPWRRSVLREEDAASTSDAAKMNPNGLRRRAGTARPLASRRARSPPSPSRTRARRRACRRPRRLGARRQVRSEAKPRRRRATYSPRSPSAASRSPWRFFGRPPSTRCFRPSSSSSARRAIRSSRATSALRRPRASTRPAPSPRARCASAAASRRWS
mmetsp:Transcript_24696/g.74219  ORF Transcript_24696/g.74219 Transcript_24696/m.74219 type:complete len:214 (+) Transcript_24696:151-792(+)